MAPLSSPGTRAEEEIERLLQSFVDGWNRRDAEACFSDFAPAADFVDAAARWWRGRREIVERHAALPPDGALRIDRVSIRFLRPDVAVVHAGWERGGRRGLMTLVTSRERGRWGIDAAQNSDQTAI
jgi:uncharacterized protein (TIGR02246 family)